MEKQERIIGSLIRRVMQTDSTNRRLRLKAAALPEGAVYRAEHQTAGKGRLNRTWFSTPDSLTFSFLIRPQLARQQLPLLALFPAVSVARTLREYGPAATVKWPNDIEAGGKKIGGILVENRVKNDRAIESVIGVGLNVNQAGDDWPDEIRRRAGSMRSITGHRFDKEELFFRLIDNLDEDYRRFFQPLQVLDLQHAWLAYCGHFHKDMAVTVRGQRVTGTFEALSENGGAVLSSGGIRLIIENFDGIEEAHAADD